MTVSDDTLDAAGRVVAARLTLLLDSISPNDRAYESLHGKRHRVEAELEEAGIELERVVERG